jgi:rRNA pseudouridine-1189 N-methylase Emg1 (Nep1/Mra1 family)
MVAVHCAGHPVHGFLTKFGVAFTPAAVKLLTAAFDNAWFALQASGAPYSTPEYAEAARTHLAKFIIGAAQRGEWDQKKLSDDALVYLSQQSLSRVPPKTVLP